MFGNIGFSQTPFMDFVAETNTQITYADSFEQPLSEPVRRRPPYKAANQQFAAFVKALPFIEVSSVDKWFAPFSEPTRYRRALLTANHQFTGWTPEQRATINMSVTFVASSLLSAAPSGNYKSILSETSRPLIYATEISPWTLS